MNVTRAHRLNEAIHVTCFPTVSEGKLVFRRGKPQRSNHHRSESVGKFALEHRAFAGDDTVVLPHFSEEKWRVNVRETDLPRALEIAIGPVEVLRHHAEIDLIRTQHVPYLPQHFLNAHVAAGIARAVIAGEEQLQFFGRRPALSEPQHPTEPGN